MDAMARLQPHQKLGLLAVLVVAAACALPAKPGSNGGSNPPTTTGSPTAGSTLEGTTTVEEFVSDIQGAVGSAEDYWTSAFRASGLTFVPIGRVTPYQRAGEQVCGGSLIPVNNAVYCPQGDFIAYDVRWALASFRTIGDAFLYFLIGHEYAHGIQARLHITHAFTIEHELQADCMAGAYLGDSVRSREITLDTGDLDEFQAGLAAVADDPNQPWFAEGSHGSISQRTNAFFAGYQNSLAACQLS